MKSIKITRAAAALTAGVLLLSLAGCGATGDEAGGGTSANPAGSTTAMGRWVETAIDFGGDYYFYAAPTALADGSLVIYGLDVNESGDYGENSKTHKFTSADGITWQEQALDWNERTGGVITRVVTSPDGTAFFDSNDWNSGDSQYWLQAPGKELEAFALPSALGEASYLQSMMFLDDDLLFFTLQPTGEQDTAPAYLLQMSTMQLTECDGIPYGGGAGARGEAVTRDEDGAPALEFCAYPGNGADMSLMRLTTDGEIAELCEGVALTGAACADADGNYYYDSLDGICRMVPGGTLEEVIVAADGTMLSLGYTTGLSRTPDGDFYAAFMPENGSSGGLYRYHYDETLPANAENALTIWSLENNDTIRAAILTYGKTDPDTAVRYTPALGMGDSYDDSDAARADAIQQLNTELLAGQGPDVIIFDGVDYAPYAAKGLLADLSGAVEPAALVQNITAPFLEDGKAYVMPARFGVPVILGDDGTLGGLTSLDALTDAVLAAAPRADVNVYHDDYYVPLGNGEKYAFAFKDAGEVTRFVMESSATALLDENGLDTDAVRALLGFVDTTAQHYGMKDYNPDQTNNVSASSYGGDVVVLMDDAGEYRNSRAEYGWTTMQTPALCYDFARDPTLMADIDPRFDVPENAVDPANMSGNYVNCDLVQRPGLCEGAYLPTTLSAVNAAGDVEKALAFVEVLFGSAVQDIYCYDGLPVRADSLQGSLDRNEKAAKDNNKNGYACFKGDINALLAACKTPVLANETVNAAILTHAKALVAGTETLDEAVAGVQSDLALYLAERSA